jgi:diguanylate cyclase (GGDEF)-like protein
MNPPPPPFPRILIVEDEAVTALDLSGELRQMGCEVCGIADTYDSAVATARQERPDLILMDVRLRDGDDGVEAAMRICAEHETAIVFLSAHSDDTTLNRALSVAPFSYLVKPFRARELKLAIQVALCKRAKDALASRELGELALTDPLTGLGNRRKMDVALADEWSRAARERQQLAALVVDVDHFKPYNDLHGHLAGDQCLKLLAATIRPLCGRPGDLVCRWGGDEFLVLLPATDAAGAARIARAILAGASALRLPHGASNVSPVVTVSVGSAAVVPSDEDSLECLVRRADEALYAAKKAGGNRGLCAGSRRRSR